jgi:hypothetical protein
MNIRRYTAALGAALACIVLSCSHQQPQKKAACIVGTDTLTQSSIAQLVPGELPQEQKVSRAALQCALSKLACTGDFGPQDKGFYSDLSVQLSSRTGDAWTPQAAASLYLAARALKKKMRELPSARAVAVYVDSLFAGAVQQAGGVRQQLLMNDSLLKTLDNITTRQDLEKTLAAVFRIPLGTAGVLADFLSSEELEKRAESDASSYVKGLVAGETKHETQAVRHVGPSAEELLKKTQENLKLALAYRTQQSISDSIKRHLPNLEALYKKQLKIHQTLSGTVWVTFVISPSGRVASARIKSSDIRDKDFLNPFCTYVEKIHFLKIPEELGQMTFEFPFEFAPEE